MRHTTNTLLAAALLAGLTGLASASDLNLRIDSGGAPVIAVAPSTTIFYTIIGELSDGTNEGLAMFALDLTFDGGALTPAATPIGGPMLDFTAPAGFTNPAGFGGTVVPGGLRQVGGAQNTIKNFLTSAPTGVVQPGIAAAGSAEVLVVGSLVAPAQPGTYELSVSGAFVNVIRAGEDGTGTFWAVDGAELGEVTGLVVIVLDCSAASYCEPKLNSQGCLATTATSGAPTLSGADDFHVTATEVVNAQFGALIWSLAPDLAPFQGGTRCVSRPFQRMATQATAGSPPPTSDCSGTLDQFLPHSTMTLLGWNPGTTVFTQFLYRDPASSDGTALGMTDGVAFTVCP
jgi:hypothetical protein